MGSKWQLFYGFIAVITQLLSIGYVFWIIKAELGVEQLGLWALVLSSLSIVNISNFGLGQAMVHFSQVSMQKTAYSSQFERYFRTAFSLTALGALILSASIYLPVQYFILDLAGPTQTNLVLTLIPLMMASLCAAVLNRVMIFTLNGQGSFWIGQIAVMLGSLFYVALSATLINSSGLMGVAYGHFIMTFSTLLLGWAGVIWVRAREGNARSLLWPFGIYPQAFRDMIGLGISFQLTSILMLFLEPLARFAIGYSGNLSMVGYYEMANRFVVTPREIIARPAAYFSGRFAQIGDSNRNAMNAFYASLMKKFSLLGIGMLLSIAILAVPVADYWVQERNWFFLVSVATLGLGWTFGVPALVPWQWGIGLGLNQFNLMSIAIMMLVSLTVSSIAIIFQSPIWIPFGVGAAIALGEIYLILRVSQLLRSHNKVSNLRRLWF